jgi:hypothetical protein
MGVDAPAIAMRLQRGKVALRRILTTEFGPEFSSYAPDLSMRHGWEETTLWCSVCGRHHLLGRYHVTAGELWLRCPECAPDPKLRHTHIQLPGVLAQVRGYQRAYSRILAWERHHYFPHLRNQRIPCPHCGQMAPRGGERPHDTYASPLGNNLGIRLICACGFDSWQSLDGLALATPQGGAFRRRAPRMRTLPYHYVEAAGRPAVVSRFESLSSTDYLAVVADVETFEPLRIEVTCR